MSKRHRRRTTRRSTTAPNDPRPATPKVPSTGKSDKTAAQTTSSVAVRVRPGLKGGLLVGVAAFSLLLSLPLSGPFLHLLTGGPKDAVAVFAWNVSALTVGSAAVMLLLVGHAEMRLARDPRVRRWGQGRLLTDSLTFIATAVLWALAFSFLVVTSPSRDIQVLDMLGRAASLGSIVGLAASAIWGTRLYVEVFPRLATRAKVEAFIVMGIGGAIFPIVWFS